MIYWIMGILSLWLCLGAWFFLENMGKKWRVVGKIQTVLEFILLAPLFLVLIPVGIHQKYKDWKRRSKITSV